jgi:anaerobic selenocysteine-containing dehydrogenase
MYGKMAGVAFPDYPEAELILIWGANPRASNIHLVPFLRDAKARGAFIALVDPIRTLSSDLIDLHLPVFPGADLPLALGMIHHWVSTGRLDRAFLDGNAVGLETLLEAASEWSLDRAAKASRVDRESVRLLADRYAEASPAILRCGWGLERNRNGGQAAAAVLAMPALLGKFGRRGGGYTLSNSGAGKIDASKLWDTSSWTTRVINMTELARVLNEPLSPPIRGLFVYNCNPVATVPDQNGILRGLMREDLFTVVFEQVMTDTARYADILLPATTFLEHYDFKRSTVVGATKPWWSRRGSAEQRLGLRRARRAFAQTIFHWPEEELEASGRGHRARGKTGLPRAVRQRRNSRLRFRRLSESGAARDRVSAERGWKNPSRSRVPRPQAVCVRGITFRVVPPLSHHAGEREARQQHVR